MATDFVLFLNYYISKYEINFNFLQYKKIEMTLVRKVNYEFITPC